MSFKRRIATWVVGLTLACAVCPVLEAAADEAGEVDENGNPKPPPAAAESSSSTLKNVAGYALSIGGTFVVVAIVIYTLSRTLKYEQARNAIVHLLRTNPNQAEMQCMSLPHSFYDAIGATLKTGTMLGGVQDPAMIAQATAPTYDAVGQQVIQHWKSLIGKAKLAGVAAAGAIVLKPGFFTGGLGVLAIGGLLWLMYYKMEVDRSIFRAKVEVLPEVDRAFADGRYYIPPKS
jgi:hypothetical protein